ncbi:MAG: bifunctional riboflavin kinase/FAD synthetase [Alphaproteobacteria bacterium]|nr:bifunctional riboflavin kinase/FAD synthetase [Alphaproteobacteria bacterium]
MQILRHYTDLSPEIKSGVVALGNFDGVHLGHQAIFNKAKKIAESIGAPFNVLTFEPHPIELFNPYSAPFRLTPYRMKAHIIELTGCDTLFMQRFTEEFACMTAEEFVKKVLHDEMQAKHIVVGYNFSFGSKERGIGCAGDPKKLKRLTEKYGIKTTVLDRITAPDGTECSSTTIRKYIRHGDMANVRKLLGRNYEVENRIVHGEKKGRLMGYPTANLLVNEYIMPRPGSYAVKACINRDTSNPSKNVWHDAVANFGHRPTFGHKDWILEVNLFDFDEDIYDQYLCVSLVEHIRREQKFSGMDELKAAINKDAEKSKEILKKL